MLSKILQRYDRDIRRTIIICKEKVLTWLIMISVSRHNGNNKFKTCVKKMIFSEFWPQKGPLNQEVQELSVFSCLTLFHHIFTFHFRFSDREDVWLRDYHLLRVLASLPCIFHLLLLRPSHHGQMVRFYSHDSPGNVFQVPFTWYPWKGFLVFVHMLSLEILFKFSHDIPGVFVHKITQNCIFQGTPKTCIWPFIGWQWLTAASTQSYTIGWTKGELIMFWETFVVFRS